MVDKVLTDEEIETFKDRMFKVSDGIDLLIDQFVMSEQQYLFPRMMAAGDKFGIWVNSKQEILSNCIKANFLDCRLNAYARIPDRDIAEGYIVPNHLFSDIDKSNFINRKTGELKERELKNSVKSTRERIIETFNTEPTILYTGGGYHFYVVVSMPQLNRYADLMDICKPLGWEISREFLRFSEIYMTNSKNDSRHSDTLSMNSALLRIPFTLNSKYGTEDNEVKIIQKYKGIGTVPRWYLVKFKTYLVDKQQQYENKRIARLKAMHRVIEQRYNYEKVYGFNYNQHMLNRYAWIEKLLASPISENRYFCIWRIIAPYLVKIKQLTPEESERQIRQWLYQCNEIKRVINFEKKLKDGLMAAAGREYNPISFKTLEEKNKKHNGAYENVLMAICASAKILT